VLPPHIAARPRTLTDERPPLEAVTPTVHLAQGSFGASSSVLVCGRDERIVVNTGGAADAAVHRRAYDTVHDGPIRYLVMTQGHPDHYACHEELSDPGTQLVAHRTFDRAADDWVALKNAKGRRLKVWFEPTGFMSMPEDSVAGLPLPPTPDIAVDDERTEIVGGREIHLFATPGAESTDGISVWLPDERVAIVGNLFGAVYGAIPNLQTVRGDRIRDPLVVLASFRRVLALDPEILVVGHHGPVVGAAAVRETVTRIADATQWVHDQTVAGLEAGKDVPTLMREVRLPEHLEVLQNYGWVPWNVRAVATLYLGWFEARSTLELYPTAPTDVAHELVALAGGAEPLVARARTLLDQGDHLRSLQLVEQVLAVEPSHAAALGVYIGCHELLLAEHTHGNVWLGGWLRWQIATAKATGARPTAG
jgi:alkyl sulfatase BDS1-like metallo-beta-lactamase superfamily hydrolase